MSFQYSRDSPTLSSSNFVLHLFPRKNRIDSNVPAVCSRKIMNTSKQINKRRYESCTWLPFSKWIWDWGTGREGHLLLKVPDGRGRGITEGIIASNNLLPHQTTMLSDTLDLFVSRATEGLTDRSQTRGLGCLETSLTSKESGWGATMEVEKGWARSSRSSLTARVWLDPDLHRAFPQRIVAGTTSRRRKFSISVDTFTFPSFPTSVWPPHNLGSSWFILCLSPFKLAFGLVSVFFLFFFFWIKSCIVQIGVYL